MEVSLVNFIKALDGVTSRGATLPDIDDVLATDAGETSSVSGFDDVARSRALAGIPPGSGLIGQPGINRFGALPTAAPQGPYGNPVQQALASGAGVFGPLPPVGGPVGTYRVIPSEPLLDANTGKGSSVNMTFRSKPKEEPEPKADTTKVSDEVSSAEKEQLVARGYSEEEADTILGEVKKKAEEKKDGDKKTADEKFAAALEGLPVKGENAKWQKDFGNWYARFRDFKGDGLVEGVTTDRVKKDTTNPANYAIVKPKHVNSGAKGLVAYDVVQPESGDGIKKNDVIYRDNDGKWYKGSNGTEPIADAFYDATQNRLYLEATTTRARTDITDATALMRSLEGAAGQSVKEETKIAQDRRAVLAIKLDAVASSKFTASYDDKTGKYTVEYSGTADEFKVLKPADFDAAFSFLPVGAPIVFKFKKNADAADFTSITITRDRAYEDIYYAWFGESVPVENRPASAAVAPTP